jgi:hypothetical protein
VFKFLSLLTDYSLDKLLNYLGVFKSFSQAGAETQCFNTIFPMLIACVFPLTSVIKKMEIQGKMEMEIQGKHITQEK